MTPQEQTPLEFNADWLREMRARLGWSITTAAKRAGDKAREFGDSIKLSQQLVSKLENGRFKSIPRWLGYMQLAMADEIQEKGLPEGRLWKLKFPPEIQNYFEEIFLAQNRRTLGFEGEFDDTEAEFDDDGLTNEDWYDIELLNQLSAEAREAVRTLMRTLAGRTPPPTPAPSPAQTTLHDPVRNFRTGSRKRGEAA